MKGNGYVGSIGWVVAGWVVIYDKKWVAAICV